MSIPRNNLHGGFSAEPSGSLRETGDSSEMRKNWTQKQERGSMLLIRLIAWIATTISRRAARLLLYPITLYFMLTAVDSRRASQDYLGRVLQRKPRRIEVFRHFHCFAGALLDRVFFLKGRSDLFDIRVIDDAYAAQDSATRGSGVFLMGAHYGSFESVRLASRSNEQLKLVLLMYEENAKKISSLMAAINPQAQQEIVPLGNLSAMLTVKERLEEGAIIGILADRTFSDEKTCVLPFLGKPAAFPVGPFKMAAMMRKPVFFMAGVYRGGNRYDIHLEKIADFSDREALSGQTMQEAIDAAMKHYVARIEFFCREAPYNWFNFYDFWQGGRS
ncbi:MAG: acyl-CoA synthetase [Burkholderiaceae bacterium]